MNFAKFLKYTVIVATTLIAAFLVGMFGLIFWFLSKKDPISTPRTTLKSIHAHKSAEPAIQDNTGAGLPTNNKNADRRPLSKRWHEIRERGEKETQLLKEITKDIATNNPPEICEIICHPVPESYKTQSYRDYYALDGRRALDNPLFRIKYEQLNLVVKLISNPVLNKTMSYVDELEGIDFENLSLAEQSWWAIRIQSVILGVVYELNSVVNENSQKSKMLINVEKLRSRCESEPFENIRIACETYFNGNG